MAHLPREVRASLVAASSPCLGVRDHALHAEPHRGAAPAR